MNMRRLAIAMAIGAVIAAVILILAAPAKADTYEYWSYVQDQGVPGDISILVDAGKEVCHGLRSGYTADQIYIIMAKRTNWAGMEIATIIVAAAHFLCPDMEGAIPA